MDKLETPWIDRFLAEAKQRSTWSKDPSKQIGAVAVSDDKQILSSGYNGFPRGIDDLPERYADRDTKYKYVVHAEQNLIYNACLNGVSLKDSHVFVHGLPVCHECAKGLIQVGVRSVISVGEINERWLESFKITKELFSEANIFYYHFPTDHNPAEHIDWAFLCNT